VSVTADLVAARKVGGFTRVYPVGEVPATPGYPYVVIGYAPNAPVVRTQDAAGDPIRRFFVQHFGRTANGVEDQGAISIATFDGQPIGGDVCQLEVATLPGRDPDDRGVLTTTHTYRF
jgi:hypothetical protein